MKLKICLFLNFNIKNSEKKYPNVTITNITIQIKQRSKYILHFPSNFREFLTLTIPYDFLKSIIYFEIM